MTCIGYTTDLTDDTLVEIEILDEYQPYDTLYRPNEKSWYVSKKWNIKNTYDLHGELIDINSKREKFLEKESIIFVKDMQIGFENLRQKMFFDETYIEHYDSDDDNLFFEFNIVSEKCIEIYKKKDNIDINFSGIQNIYDSKGNLRITFYHVNGIKEGKYEILCGMDKKYIFNFINDIQIGDMIKTKGNFS